jgi:TrmH family RNA methyltransferase
MSAAIIKIFTQNSDFQYIETLRRNRVKRHQSQEFFVEGVRSIDQALQNNWEISAFVYSKEKRLSDWAENILQNSLAKKHYELPFNLLKELSLRDDPSELIALITMPGDALSRIPVGDNPLVVILDRPVLPGNIGSVIRSCDALRVDGLIITGHSADLYDPETIRATTGSFFSIPTVRLSSHRQLIPWIEQLKNRFPKLQVVGTSAKAKTPIQDFNFSCPTILLAGNETHGISENYRALCDDMITILMSGSASSLNLACAVSIMLYEIDRQRRQIVG